MSWLLLAAAAIFGAPFVARRLAQQAPDPIIGTLIKSPRVLYDAPDYDIIKRVVQRSALAKLASTVDRPVEQIARIFDDAVYPERRFKRGRGSA